MISRASTLYLNVCLNIWFSTKKYKTCKTHREKSSQQNHPGKSPDCTYQTTTLNHHFKYVQRSKIHMLKELKESMRIMAYQIKNINTEK